MANTAYLPPSWSAIPPLTLDSLNFRTDTTDRIETELDSPIFNPEVIRKYHSTRWWDRKYRSLQPKEAEKVVAFVAKKFGKEAMMWTLAHVRGAFHQETFSVSGSSQPFDSNGGRELITTEWRYPFSQLRILKFLSSEFHSPETSIKALDILGFYKVTDSDRLIGVITEDLPEMDHAKTAQTLLPLPVHLMGAQFGQEAAKATATLSKRHYRFRDAEEEIQKGLEGLRDEEAFKEIVQSIRHDDEIRCEGTHYLASLEANSIIQMALKNYGAETTLWTVGQLRHAFNYVKKEIDPIPTPFSLDDFDRECYFTRYIDIKSQIDVMKLFIYAIKCPETALKALKALRFYDVSSNEIMPTKYLETQHGDEVISLLLKPIEIMGEKFGVEWARKTIDLASSHRELDNDQVHQKMARLLIPMKQTREDHCIIS